ncbi:hypothetical protein Tco_1430748 [Tanacetum coccineum]
MDLDSLKDDQPLLISSNNEADIQAEVQAKTKVTIVPPPPSPKSIKIQELTNQLTELLVNALKPELTQLLTNHDSIASIPTELKELQSKVNEIDGIVGDLKNYMAKLEIDVPGDLKALPEKLEEFHTSIVAPTNKVTSLEDIRLEIPAGLHALLQVLAINAQLTKLKVLDALPSKKDLIDIVGLDVVEKVYKDKVNYDKYCLQMLNKGPKAGKELYEPTLGMILCNSQQRQDFISIEDFEELNNDMVYHVQEIFFKLHQGLRTDDLARTFSSFLVAEVDKRNLNPLKQMRKQIS